jgi:hypothetical protein
MMIMATDATKGLSRRNIPMVWEERARIWKDAFRISPALQPHEFEALKFLRETQDVAMDRNAIVHGLWERINAGPPLRARIVIIRPTKGTKDGFDFSREAITLDQVREVAQKASHLDIERQMLSKLLAAQRGAPPSDVHIL